MGERNPPFDQYDPDPFKKSLYMFIPSPGMIPDWSIRPDQPMHLSITTSLSKIMNNKDITLFPMLLEGAPTGFDSTIPSSGCLPIALDETDEAISLSIHSSNWHSAELDLPMIRDLVAQELAKGWIYRYHGSLIDAQADFGGQIGDGTPRLGSCWPQASPVSCRLISARSQHIPQDSFTT